MSNQFSMKGSTKPLKGMTVSSNFGSFETLTATNLQLESINIAGLFEDGIFQNVVIKDSQIFNTVIGAEGPNVGYFSDLYANQKVKFISNMFGSYVEWDPVEATLNLANSDLRVNQCSYLGNLEICQNLQYADFFYFNKPLITNSLTSNQPLLRFNLKSDYFKNISEFSRIFDIRYYRLGKICRSKINNRLNLKLNNQIQTITYADIFAIIDSLITLSVSKTIGDDIDHLKNRRVRSVGELLQTQFRLGLTRLERIISERLTICDPSVLKITTLVNPKPLISIMREFFGSSQLSN